MGFPKEDEFHQMTDVHLNAEWAFNRREWSLEVRRACRMEASQRLEFMTQEEKNTPAGIMLREIADEVEARIDP